MSYPDNLNDQAFDRATGVSEDASEVADAIDTLRYIQSVKAGLAVFLRTKAKEAPFVWPVDDGVLQAIFDMIDDDDTITDEVRINRSYLEDAGRNDLLEEELTNEQLSKPGQLDGVFDALLENMGSIYG